MLDNRHTIQREWTGKKRPQWVLRFCGDFVTACSTKHAARRAAKKWERARLP